MFRRNALTHLTPSFRKTILSLSINSASTNATQYTGGTEAVSKGQKSPKALHKELMQAGLSDAEAKKVVDEFKSTTKTDDPGKRMEAAMSAAGISTEKSQIALKALNGGKAKETSSDASSTDSSSNSAILKKLLETLGYKDADITKMLNSVSASTASSSTASDTASTVTNQINSSGFTA